MRWSGRCCPLSSAQECEVWLLLPSRELSLTQGRPVAWGPEEGSIRASLLCPQPLCPKELWHFVHQCYGNELGLTSDDEDYVPPDDDFNTMG